MMAGGGGGGGGEVVIEYEVAVPPDMARELGQRVREGRFDLSGVRDAWAALESAHGRPAECSIDLDVERAAPVRTSRAAYPAPGALSPDDIAVSAGVAAIWRGAGVPQLFYAEQVERRGRRAPFYVLVSAENTLYLLDGDGACVRCLPCIDAVTVARDGWVSIASPHNGAVLFRPTSARRFVLYSPVEVLYLNETGAHTTQNLPLPLPPIPCCPDHRSAALTAAAEAPPPPPALPEPSASPALSLPSASALQRLDATSDTSTTNAGDVHGSDGPVLFSADLPWKASDDPRPRRGIVAVTAQLLELHGRPDGVLRISLAAATVGNTQSSVVVGVAPHTAMMLGIPREVRIETRSASELDRLMLAIDSVGDEGGVGVDTPQSDTSDASSAVPPPPALHLQSPPSHLALRPHHPSSAFASTASRSIRTPGTTAAPAPIAFPPSPAAARPVPLAAAASSTSTAAGFAPLSQQMRHRQRTPGAQLGAAPSAPVFGYQDLTEVASRQLPIFTSSSAVANDHWGGPLHHPLGASTGSPGILPSTPPARWGPAAVGAPSSGDELQLAALADTLEEDECADRSGLRDLEASSFNSVVVLAARSRQRAAKNQAYREGSSVGGGWASAAALALSESPAVSAPSPPSPSPPPSPPPPLHAAGHGDRASAAAAAADRREVETLRAALAVEQAEWDERRRLAEQHDDWRATVEDAARLAWRQPPQQTQPASSHAAKPPQPPSASVPGAAAAAPSLTQRPATPGTAGGAFLGNAHDRAYRSGVAAARQAAADAVAASPLQALDAGQEAGLRGGLLGAPPPSDDVAVGVRLAFVRGLRSRVEMAVIAAAAEAPAAFWEGVVEGVEGPPPAAAAAGPPATLAPRPVAESSAPFNLQLAAGGGAEAAVLVAKLGELGGGVAEVVWAHTVNPGWAPEERWVLLLGTERLWLCSGGGAAAQTARVADVRRAASSRDGWVALEMDGAADVLLRPLADADGLLDALARLRRSSGVVVERGAAAGLDELLDGGALRVPPSPPGCGGAAACLGVPVVVGGSGGGGGSGGKDRAAAARAGVEAATDLLGSVVHADRAAFAHGALADDAAAVAAALAPDGVENAAARRGTEAREVLAQNAVQPTGAFWAGVAAACVGVLHEARPLTPHVDPLLLPPPPPPPHHHHTHPHPHDTLLHLPPEHLPGPTVSASSPPLARVPARSLSGESVAVVEPDELQLRETLRHEVALLRSELAEEARRLSPVRELETLSGAYGVRAGDPEAPAEIADDRCELFVRVAAAADVGGDGVVRQFAALQAEFEAADADVAATLAPLACGSGQGQPLVRAACKVLHVGPSRSAHRILLVSDAAVYVVQCGVGRPCRVRRCVDATRVVEVLEGRDGSIGLVLSDSLPLVVQVPSGQSPRRLLEALLPPGMQAKRVDNASAAHSLLYKGCLPGPDDCDTMYPLTVACSGGVQPPVRVVDVAASQLQQAAAAFAPVPQYVAQLLRAPHRAHVAVLWGSNGRAALAADDADGVPATLIITPTAATVVPRDGRGLPRSVPVASVGVFIAADDGWLGIASLTRDSAGVVFRPEGEDGSSALGALRRACAPARIRCVRVPRLENVGVALDGEGVVVPVTVLVPCDDARMQRRLSAPAPAAGEEDDDQLRAQSKSPDELSGSDEEPAQQRPLPAAARSSSGGAAPPTSSSSSARQKKKPPPPPPAEHVATPDTPSPERARVRRSPPRAAALTGTLVPPPVSVVGRAEAAASLPAPTAAVPQVVLNSLPDDVARYFALVTRQEPCPVLYWAGKATGAGGGCEGTTYAVFVSHAAVYVASGAGRILRCDRLSDLHSVCIADGGCVGFEAGDGERVGLRLPDSADAAALCHAATVLGGSGLKLAGWDPTLHGVAASASAVDPLVAVRDDEGPSAEQQQQQPPPAVVGSGAGGPSRHSLRSRTASPEAASHSQRTATPPHRSRRGEPFAQQPPPPPPPPPPARRSQDHDAQTRAKPSVVRVSASLSRPWPSPSSSAAASGPSAPITEPATPPSLDDSDVRPLFPRGGGGGATGEPTPPWYVQLQAEVSILDHSLRDQSARCDEIAVMAHRYPETRACLDAAKATLDLDAEVLRILKAHLQGRQGEADASRSMTLSPVDVTRVKDGQARAMAGMLKAEGSVPLVHFVGMVTTHDIEGIGALGRPAAQRQLLVVGDQALYLISTDSRVDRCIGMLSITSVHYTAPVPSCYVGIKVPGSWDVLARCASFTDAALLRTVLCNLCPGAKAAAMEDDAAVRASANRRRPPASELQEGDLVKITNIVSPFVQDHVAEPQHVSHADAFEATAPASRRSPPRSTQESHGLPHPPAPSKPALVWDKENGLASTAHADLPANLLDIVPRDMDPLFYIGSVRVARGSRAKPADSAFSTLKQSSRASAAEEEDAPLTLLLGRHSLVLISEEDRCVVDTVAYVDVQKMHDADCRMTLFYKQGGARGVVAWRVPREIEARELASVLQTLYRRATGGRALAVTTKRIHVASVQPQQPQPQEPQSEPPQSQSQRPPQLQVTAEDNLGHSLISDVATPASPTDGSQRQTSFVLPGESLPQRTTDPEPQAEVRLAVEPPPEEAAKDKPTPTHTAAETSKPFHLSFVMKPPSTPSCSTDSELEASRRVQGNNGAHHIPSIQSVSSQGWSDTSSYGDETVDTAAPPLQHRKHTQPVGQTIMDPTPPEQPLRASFIDSNNDGGGGGAQPRLPTASSLSRTSTHRRTDSPAHTADDTAALEVPAFASPPPPVFVSPAYQKTAPSDPRTAWSDAPQSQRHLPQTPAHPHSQHWSPTHPDHRADGAMAGPAASVSASTAAPQSLPRRSQHGHQSSLARSLPQPPPLRLVHAASVPPELGAFEKLLSRNGQTAVVHALAPCLRIASGRPDEPRVILISDTSLYQMSRDTRVNRCVPVTGIAEVLYTAAGLLGLRIPTEFDMLVRVAAGDVTDIIQVLRALHPTLAVEQLEYSVQPDSIEAALSTTRPPGWAPAKTSVVPLRYIGPRSDRSTVAGSLRRRTATQPSPWSVEFEQQQQQQQYAAAPPSGAEGRQQPSSALRAISPTRPPKTQQPQQEQQPQPDVQFAQQSFAPPSHQQQFPASPQQQQQQSFRPQFAQRTTVTSDAAMPVAEGVPSISHPDPSRLAPCGLSHAQIHQILF